MEKQIEIPEYCNRTYAEIDLDAIVENMKNMKANIASETKMAGV